MEELRVLGFQLLRDRARLEEGARAQAARGEQALRALQVELAATAKKLAEAEVCGQVTGREDCSTILTKRCFRLSFRFVFRFLSSCYS